MSFRVALRFVLAALLLCGLAPAVAVAQAGPESAAAPSASAVPTRRDAALLTLSTTVATNGSRVGGVASREPREGGADSNSDFQAAFKYDSTPGGKVSWKLGAGTAGRRRQSPGEFLWLGHNVGGDVGFSLGKKTSVRANQTFGYVPSYSLVPSAADTVIPSATDALDTLGQVPASAVDYSLAKRPAYVSSSSVSLARSLSSRSEVNLGYALQRTTFASDADPSLKSWNANARYKYRIAKFLGLRAGYGRRSGRYSSATDANAVNIDDLDLGVDFNQALSFSVTKRTTLAFRTGSSLTTVPNRPRRFVATANANLDRAIGRTGQVGVEYNRGVTLLQGFAAPVFSDSVGASGQGRLTRRLNLRVSAVCLLGNVGASGIQNRYRSYTGSSLLTYSFSQRIGFNAQYLYYKYGIGDAVREIGAVPPAQARHTGRVGLTVAVPVIRQWVIPREGEGR